MALYTYVNAVETLSWFTRHILSGVYTSNLLNDLEFYMGQILSLYEAKSLGKYSAPKFSFIKGQYLAQIKIQIGKQIGCVDASLATNLSSVVCCCMRLVVLGPWSTNTTISQLVLNLPKQQGGESQSVTTTTGASLFWNGPNTQFTYIQACTGCCMRFSHLLRRLFSAIL